MSISNRVQLPSKLAGETRLYEFDFTSKLAAGETISTMVVTNTVYSGVDANPTAMVSGAEVNAIPIVKQMITGGTAGVIYDLLCTITTSLSQTLQLAGYLYVEPDLP